MINNLGRARPKRKAGMIKFTSHQMVCKWLEANDGHVQVINIETQYRGTLAVYTVWHWILKP